MDNTTFTKIRKFFYSIDLRNNKLINGRVDVPINNPLTPLIIVENDNDIVNRKFVMDNSGDKTTKIIKTLIVGKNRVEHNFNSTYILCSCRIYPTLSIYENMIEETSNIFEPIEFIIIDSNNIDIISNIAIKVELLIICKK